MSRKHLLLWKIYSSKDFYANESKMHESARTPQTVYNFRSELKDRKTAIEFNRGLTQPPITGENPGCHRFHPCKA